MLDAVDFYLRELRRECRMLSQEEEAEAWWLWKGTSDPYFMQQLATSVLRWAFKVAIGYRGKGFSKAELISFSYDAVLASLHSFNPAKGRLTTHVISWVRQVILRELQRHTSIIATPDKGVYCYRRNGEEKRQRRAERIARAKHICNLAVRYPGADSDEDIGYPDHREADPFDIAVASEAEASRKKEVKELLARLTPRQAYILQARAEGHTLQEIGAVLGISRERVRQIAIEANAKLRDIKKRQQRAEENRQSA